jgi:hypothetical protein
MVRPIGPDVVVVIDRMPGGVDAGSARWRLLVVGEVGVFGVL